MSPSPSSLAAELALEDQRTLSAAVSRLNEHLERDPQGQFAAQCLFEVWRIDYASRQFRVPRLSLVVAPATCSQEGLVDTLFVGCTSVNLPSESELS